MLLVYEFPRETVEVESSYMPMLGDIINDHYGIAHKVVRRSYAPNQDKGYIICERF